MTETSLILAVDHNRRNLELLGQFLGKEGFQLRTASSIEEFDAAVSRAESIEFALMDIAGFDRRIWDRCEQLRERKIPFLLLSSRQSAAIQQMSVSRGALGVLVKPLVVRDLIGLIRNLLEEGG